MQGTTNANHNENELLYPYRRPQNFHRIFTDPYERRNDWLVASLARFGRRIVRQAVFLTEDPEGVSLLQRIPTITRYCNGASLPLDFQVMLDNYPPGVNKSSFVLNAQALEQNQTDLLEILGNVAVYNQIIFYQNLDEHSWTIYLVLIPEQCIAGYFIGNVDMTQFDLTVLQIQNLLAMALPHNSFAVRHRVRIPPSLSHDPVVMAYMMVTVLFHHGKYLDLKPASISQYTVATIADLRHRHDKYLGMLQVQFKPIKSHPFICCVNKKEDKLKTPVKLGWAVIDVDGDGNCGYYSLILGLENIGRMDYSVTNLETRRMPNNPRWQYNIMRLRRDLQVHSRELFDTIYPRGSRNDEWFFYSTVVGDNELEQLSDCFHTTTLRQQDYFNGSLKEKANIKYQMTPYWTAHVVACLFRIRVIVYTRNASWNGEKVSRTWSTTTTSFDFPMDKRIEQQPSLLRICDDEFLRIPTIELLYTTGWKGDRIQEPNHFQFLRRVICNAVPIPPSPVKATLRELLQRKEGNDTSVENVENDNDGTASEAMENGDSDNDHAVGDNDPAVSEAVGNLAAGEPMPPAVGDNDAAVSEAVGNLASGEPMPTGRALDAVPELHGNILNPQSAEDEHMTDDHTQRVTVQKGKRPLNSSANNGPSKKKTPSNANNGPYKKKSPPSRAEMRRKCYAYTTFFNEGFENETLQHKTPTQMLYRPSSNTYFTRQKNFLGNFTRPEPCENIEVYDQSLIDAVHEIPNRWMGPSIGDAIGPGDGIGIAPIHLTTKVATIYQQHGNPYCLSHSLASALFYCGFKWQAEGLIGKAEEISKEHFDGALEKIKSYMVEIVPLIGLPTIHQKRTKSHGRKKRKLTMDDIFTKVTPYPTIVIPLLDDGTTTHAFCVVDDLIFDSTTPYALKLQRESVEWIFNGQNFQLFRALRFETKISPEGTRIPEQYKRPVKFHWNHPSKILASTP